MKQNPTGFEGQKHRSGSSDGLVVSTAQLSVVVNEWISKWQADRPPSRNGQPNAKFGQSKDRYFEGAIEYLAREAGTSQKAIHRIKLKQSGFVTLTVADRILTAMGRPDLLDTEIEVVPNPHWSQERWQAWYEERTHC